MKPEDKTQAKTQTEPDAKPLPDSEVRLHREAQGERQDRSRREFEADPVIRFVIRTVVRNVAGTVSKNVKDNVQDAVSKTVADFVSRTLAGFHDKAVFRTVEIELGNNVAESEDEFEPDFDDRFVTDFVVGAGAGDMVVRTTDSVPFASD